ncbi:MAG: class I SAM-dependent methyltransferase [Planctomycetota bacterium]|jgi:ubiquinone/menaquinone biosynthesis C-methylase UbiE
MATSKKTLEEISLHETVGQQYKVRYRFPFAAEFQQERNEIILELLEGAEEMEVLDLGCGTGVMIDALAARFGTILGLDASLEMMSGVDRTPRMKLKKPVHLIMGDVESLPFAEGAMDRIVCRSILHHAESVDKALAEVYRVLKPGGRVAIAEPMNDNPLLRLARWIVRHGKSYGKIHTIDKGFVTPDLMKRIRNAGLVPDREVRYGFFAYPLCDNPDLVPVLVYCPFRESIARFLRSVDRGLAKIPGIRRLSWYAIWGARRPLEDRGET